MKTPDWINAHGQHITLSAMTSEHIRNAAAYIRRGTGHLGPLVRRGCSGFTNREWLALMTTELLRRARAGLE